MIFIGDCDLPAGEVTRLLATFPRCAFLLTSQHKTIGRAGAAHEVEPLSRAAAAELIAQEIGGQPAGLARLRLREAHRLAGGQAQRLLQYAALISSASQAGRPLRTLVPPREAAAILASGLSEPARRVLAALATFGAEIAPDYFAAVTGLPPGPGTEQELRRAGPELLNARLVTRTSGGYQITADAAAALRARRWEPAGPDIAAQGLLPYLTGARDASAPPNCALLLAIARGLVSERQHLLATRFIRAAAPATIAAGQLWAWAQMLALGTQAAIAAGNDADLQYFLEQEYTRAQLHGDKIALAAVLALLAEHTQKGQPQPQPRPASPRTIPPPSAAIPAAGTTRKPGKTHKAGSSGGKAGAGAGAATAFAVGLRVLVMAISHHASPAINVFVASGSGYQVVINPPGRYCYPSIIDDPCHNQFPAGTTVTLTASQVFPHTGGPFRWVGCPTGTDPAQPCVLTLGQSTSVCLVDESPQWTTYTCDLWATGSSANPPAGTAP